MASLYSDKSDNRRLQFRAPNGRRVILYLGDLPLRQAQTVKSYVERLLIAAASGDNIDTDTAAWLAKINDELHGKLVKAGLIGPRKAVGTDALGAFLDQYIGGKAIKKPNTAKNYEATRKSLLEFFAPQTPLASISAGDCDRWHDWQVAQGYAQATIGRNVKRAKQFFRAAVRSRLLSESPMQDLKAAAQANPDRQHYIPLANIRLLLNECRDPSERLIIGLARIAGLRIPSELVGLRWSEVNWSESRFTVHAPKTEGHGKGVRVVPIFEKLAPLFWEAWVAAPEGEDRIFPNITPETNLRTWLGKLADRAGVELWEKPWVNCRASAATDAADVFPSYVCEAFFGHSEAIANRHYRIVREEHFRKAAGLPNGAQLETRHPAHVTGGTASPQETQNPGFTGAYVPVLTCTNNHVPPRGVEPLFSD